MNASLESLMGLNQQGIPQPYGFSVDDPTYELAMQGQDPMLMQEMGVEPPNPYAELGVDPQGLSAQEMTANVLGAPNPQISQEQINAIAQSLGLGTNNMVVDGIMTDPMYAPQFDVMRHLGGY